MPAFGVLMPVILRFKLFGFQYFIKTVVRQLVIIHLENRRGGSFDSEVGCRLTAPTLEGPFPEPRCRSQT